MTKRERAEAKLAEIRTEQARQMLLVGERLGVFVRLRRLDREEKRVLKRLEALGKDPHHD